MKVTQAPENFTSLWPYRPYIKHIIYSEQTLRDKFKLSITEAKVLLFLFDARGAACSYWRIAEHASIAETSVNVRSHIKHIRRKIGQDAILARRSVNSDGYRLSPKFLQTLEELLNV